MLAPGLAYQILLKQKPRRHRMVKLNKCFLGKQKGPFLSRGGGSDSVEGANPAVCQLEATASSSSPLLALFFFFNNTYQVRGSAPPSSAYGR